MLIFTVVMVGLAIIGGIRHFYPVPVNDMWQGYLGFYQQVSEGDWLAWWRPHNEHRIVLSRLLFWLDLKLFNGQEWFLACTNYVLVLFSAFIFWQILADIKTEENYTAEKLILFLFIVNLLFFWSQYQNFTWNFQSQFILVQQLLLYALYFAHKFVQTNYARYFIFSSSLGIASLLSMGNGILALPLLTLYLFLMQKNTPHVWIILAITVISLFAYFYDYNIGQAPTLNGLKPPTLLETFIEKPVDIIQYIFIYLGSPLRYIYLLKGNALFVFGFPEILSGDLETAKYICLIAGLLVIIASIVAAINYAKNYKTATLQIALLFFIVYIIGTAIGTAGRRLSLGLIQASESRYTTPVIMVWSSLILLYAPKLFKLIKQPTWRHYSILFCIFLSLLSVQLRALSEQIESALSPRKLIALTIALKIKDKIFIERSLPNSAEYIFNLTDKIRAKNLSFFQKEPFASINQTLGTINHKNFHKNNCIASLISVEPIPENQRFLRITGVMYDSKTNKLPEFIYFLNSKKEIIGMAVTGFEFDINETALPVGYVGYVLINKLDRILSLQSEDLNCEVAIDITK